MRDPFLASDFRLPLRILIVADGLIHFKESKFGLSEFINKGLMTGINPWSRLQITTARRGEDEDKCADLPCFHFDNKSLAIDTYDQLWLFGQASEADTNVTLSDSEVETIFAFMNDGGGVFATGDHTSLGAALCGKLPRVGSMRKWYYANQPLPALKAPGFQDETRLDTLRIGDPGFQMDDQSDTIPQYIQPKFFHEPCGSASYPHALLIGQKRPITVLPDHMHEGECVIPEDLTKKFRLAGEYFDEYPQLPNSSDRLTPETVAIATSAGGYWLGQVGYASPVEPRSFKVIVAYEGDRVEVNKRKIGRVVVDSSFHHFVDINLKGTEANDPFRTGFYDEKGNPTNHYQTIKQYYRNIVKWLAPSRVRRELYNRLLIDMRFNSFLMEEIPSEPTTNPEQILHAGAATRKALVERYSKVEALECCFVLLGNLEQPLATKLEELINPWLPSALASELWPNALHQNFFIDTILGFGMSALAAELPYDGYRAAEMLSKFKSSSELLSMATEANTNGHMSGISAVLSKSRDKLAEITALLPTEPFDKAKMQLLPTEKQEDNMGPKCHTDFGEAWISYINGTYDGGFTVESEDANGYFSGHYNTDLISGRCTGVRIKFDCPATNPIYEYDGVFAASGFQIHGKRRRYKKSRSKVMTDDETWDGTKTTLAKAMRRRGTKKAAKKLTNRPRVSMKGSTKSTATKKKK